MSDDELISLLSRWLAGHASDDELRGGAARLPDVQEAFERGASRAQLMVSVRESLEELVLG